MTEETPGDSSELSSSSGQGRRGAPAEVLRRGTSLGRYVVLEPLGHGGMGVVYAAFDPHLDRKVALKLVRPDVGDGQLEGRRARLLKEAQVLARLSHPNVVAVHDLGTFAAQVFIAMEFMAGGSLADWLRTPRDWREVLARFYEAGEGLAAAHRQGIVHLDFKPDNVMLDAAGIAHVTDFGLAWTQGADTPRGGGTHSYQAPEQRRLSPANALVSAASDEFAFCVALTRALTGEAPFEPPEVVTAEPRAFPPGHAAPPWIRRALARGLSADPARRFASMEALLSALREDPALRRRRALATGGVAVLLLAALAATAAFGLRESPRARALRECEEAVAAEAQALWGPQRVEAMRAAFVAVNAQQGADTFARVAPRVAPQVTAWAQAATAQCRQPEGAPGAEATARCLAARHDELHNLSNLFHQPDAEVLENALHAVILEVLPVASCQQAPAATQAPVSKAVPAASRDELQRLLANARLLRAAGKYPEAIADALRCAALAEEARDGGLQAEAQLVAGLLFADLRRLDAEDALKRAIALAEPVRADEVRARGWLALAGWYAQRNRPEAARDAAQQADAVLARLGRPELLEAERRSQLGTLHAYARASEQAREAYDAALTLLRRHLPEEHPLVFGALANRAGQLPRAPTSRQVAASVADLQAVLATCARVFGEAHPQTALAEYHLGRVLLIGQDFAAAHAHLSRAVSLTQGQEETDPARLGRYAAALSRALAGLERWPEALDVGERGASLLAAGQAPDEELEAELRRLMGACQAQRCPAPQQARLQQLWQAAGH